VAVLVLAFKIYLMQIFLATSFIERLSSFIVNLSKNSLNLLAERISFLNIAHLLGDYKTIIEIMAMIFLLMPLIVFFAVVVLNATSGIFKALTIYRAKQKISKFANLKVIGITGSYGKSTTKEILAKVLSKNTKF